MILDTEFEKAPLINYGVITYSLEEHGLKAGLLAEPEMILKTSGSTDKPKELYYSWNDLNGPAELYHDIFIHLGLNESMSLWEMSAWIPFMSGP